MKRNKSQKSVDESSETAGPATLVIDETSEFGENSDSEQSMALEATGIHRITIEDTEKETMLIELLSRYTQMPGQMIRAFADAGDALETVVRTYLGTGDRALMAGPDADNLRILAEELDAGVIIHYGVSPFSSDVEGLLEKVSKDTRIIYLANPNHPTGTVYTTEDIKFILEQAPGTMLILDESYYEYSGITSVELTNKFENLIVIRDFAKGLGRAGYPCAYIITAARNMKNISARRSGKVLSEEAILSAEDILNNLENISYRIEQMRENMIFLSVRLRGYGISCRITPMDLLLVKVVDTARVTSFLKEGGIFAGDLSYLPQLEDYIYLVVGNDASSARVLEIFDRMPESYYRLNYPGKMRLTMHRPAEGFNPRNPSSNRRKSEAGNDAPQKI